IALPVVLRNYLEKSQTLNVSMKPESWFTLLSPAEQQTEVAAGDSATATFRFRTIASIKEGKQRVTAANRSTGDSGEKPVRVHPDGQELADTTTQLLEERATLDLGIPDYVLPGTTRAELKFYPSLMDHVLESVEAILQRPYGCGEQTISSTYPNVMLLRLYKRMGKAPDGVHARSQRYAQTGYQRLLSYVDEGGGFTYWGRGNPDVALTAYAVRFLQDASEFVAVDPGVIEAARRWLVQQQKADGTWGKSDSTTAYVARVLAATPATAPKEDESEREAAEGKKAVEMRLAALDRAIGYLSRQAAGTPDAYMLASFAMAASLAGKSEEAARARTRLAGFRHEENGAAYWALETNTPFYGWGYTGRIETTALAVQVLVQAGDRKVADPGLLFLLRNQDRYGTWYSTQATVNVLDALMLLQESVPPGSSGSTADILVNGRKAATVTLPGAGELSNPVSVDVSAFVQPGANRVEVVRSGAPQPATAQLVTAYYIPWEKSAAGAGRKVRPGDSDAISLSVAYDKTEAKAGEPVKCRVHAERIGHHGYGMLLAEIGLPPGAEVDRASLEAAVNNAGWAVQRYEVLPDRLIVYLWPQAGGTEFEFSFRPRYGMNALTAASVIYDYYNPEASAAISPVRFVIH
ncbi:MAG: hypothetical protein M3O85_00660, partial [Acidobacteriota bacterium]|nr:hypothetical protein [Acidobacteriota bacterium]